MRDRSSAAMFSIVFSGFLLLTQTGANAATCKSGNPVDVVIDNGLAPPNPANVITADTDPCSRVFVRDNTDGPVPRRTAVAIIPGAWIWGLFAEGSSRVSIRGAIIYFPFI